jgi:hypothetical protein
VGEIPQDTFEAILPLVRRTFSTFAPPERRQIGAKLAQGKIIAAPTAKGSPVNLDEARASRVIPTLKLIIGVPS